jgi:hypothetical protein
MIRTRSTQGAFMPLANHLLSDADYEAIAAAVMETSRGRWFLAEYSRRNRHADTDMLLVALQRLEKVIAGHATLPPDGVRAALADMARTLDRTKSQMAAVRSSSEGGRREGPGYEFDSVVQDQEQSTSDILAAAEHVQDMAWTLREQGVDAGHCEFLEARATDIYAACSLHDLAAQRTRRMIQALRFLDGRIGTLLAMWGAGAPAREPQPEEASSAASPPRPGETEGDRPNADATREPFTRLAAALIAAQDRADRKPGKTASVARDPLAALKALTPEEKLALFS